MILLKIFHLNIVTDMTLNITFHLSNSKRMNIDLSTNAQKGDMDVACSLGTRTCPLTNKGFLLLLIL